MRITFNMQASKYTNSIGSSLSAVSDAQDKVNYKRTLLNPEDNASAYISAYSVQRTISDLTQFTTNGKNASQWLTDADNALQEAMNLLSEAKNEYAIGGNADSNNADSRSAMAVKVKEIYNNLMDISNSTSQGQYIFSGFETNTKPFQGGNNVVTGITSLTLNGGEVAAKSVFTDLPELASDKYVATISVASGVARLSITNSVGTKMILDTNGSDESGARGNNASDELTFEYKPGAVINTGRGVSFTMPDTAESSIKIGFTYQAGSETNYAGDSGAIYAQIGYNQDVAINIPGNEIFTQSFKTLTGTKVNSVHGMPAVMSSLFSQIEKSNANIGDSIKITGSDHMGNPVGSACATGPMAATLKLTDASAEERSLLVGYGDRVYKIVIPQGEYSSSEDLALAINNQLRFAEYVGKVKVPSAGFNDIDHYSAGVQNQITLGDFRGEEVAQNRASYYVDLSNEVKASADGDRMQFVTSSAGDNVRLTVSGYEKNKLGFKNATAGAAGKDTVFEMGYEFHKDTINQIKTTHENVDLTGSSYTFYLNGKMVNVNKPATTVTNRTYVGESFPTGAGDDDYRVVINGHTIIVPAANFDGTNAGALTALNNAIDEAGLTTDIVITNIGAGYDSFDYSIAEPSAKDIEYAFNKAIRDAGLGFSYGVNLAQANGSTRPNDFGKYDITFTMDNNNITRNTQLNSVLYDTTKNPPSSDMQSATPDRFNVNLAKEKTVSDLADFISNLYNNSVAVSMQNGKLMVTDMRSGSSKLTMNIKAQNEGITHPQDQATVMGGKYTGEKNDSWQIKVTETLTNANQRDVRVVVKDARGAEIYNQLTENYLGGEIPLIYGVTITPNDMGIPNPAAPTLREKVSEFDIDLTAQGNLGFGDMNTTAEGKNVNIFRSLKNLENALNYNITQNGFSEPSAWRDESLSSTASPYLDGTFRGLSNDKFTFEAKVHNDKVDAFLQNEYTVDTGSINYNSALINKCGTEIGFGVDLYDNVDGKASRVDVNIDLSKANPPINSSTAMQEYLLKELNGNRELTSAGVRFIASGDKITMQSGAGTKIAAFANTAQGRMRALTNDIMGFTAVSNGKLPDFPLVVPAGTSISVEDSGAATGPNTPAYPYRNITIPAATYNTKEDLLIAINTEFSKAEPTGTNGRITCSINEWGALRFADERDKAVDTVAPYSSTNPFNITLRNGTSIDTLAQASQKTKTDLSSVIDAARTLTFSYTDTTPTPDVKKDIAITLDARAYNSPLEIVDAINEKLAEQNVANFDLKAVLSDSGVLAFVGNNNSIGNITVMGDKDATLGFTMAGDEAKIKVSSGNGALVQELIINTANKTSYVADGLYLGFDKGMLVATDSFTASVGSGISNEIETLDAAERQVLLADTITGNRGTKVESTTNFASTLKTSAESSKAQYLGSTDFDQVQSATNLQMAKTAYEAALASTSTIISLSLLDYLS